FQAEDGIRDRNVTGVQTCALPIFGPTNISYDLVKLAGATPAADIIEMERSGPAEIEQILKVDPDYIILLDFFGKGEKSFEKLMRSEERRVGKESRARRSQRHSMEK